MKILPIIGAVMVVLQTKAQGKIFCSLDSIIQMAQSRSSSFRLAQTQHEIAYYQYQTYKSDFKPQISLYGNAPVYSKEYFAVRQPDGTVKFQSINQSNSSLGVGFSQQLLFSGGEISLNTDLARFDDLKTKTSQYNGTPFYLRLSQPLFAANLMKWQKKIEPLKLEEAGKMYAQELQNIAQEAARLYFDVLDAQNNIEIATANQKNTEGNYAIEKRRVDLGTTTEDKLLQLELQFLRSKQDLEKAKYDHQIAQLNLRIFIGLNSNDEFSLTIPEKTPTLTINMSEAFEFARKNRPEFVSFERKKQESMRDVAQAKAAKQEVNLIASYGLNNAATRLGDIYQGLNDQQRFSLGFNIPIVDWGRRKARYNTAKAVEKLTQTTNEFEEAAIYQEVTTLVKNIELLKSNIVLAQNTNAVAHRRFAIANDLYQMGRLTVTDLNLAQSEKDNASRTLLITLRSYWNAYFILRRITLYDFENKEVLIPKAAAGR